MNFKIDSFKIRKKSWILGTFKIHKIRILNLRLGGWVNDVLRRIEPYSRDSEANVYDTHLTVGYT